MHTLARNIDQEHPRRKDVLVTLGTLTSNVIETATASPGTILSLLDLANKARYLESNCLVQIEKHISDRLLKQFGLLECSQLH